MRPGKGSGVVVLNRTDYGKSIKNLINDKTKFKELTEDVTIKRESKLQRFLFIYLFINFILIWRKS